MLLLHEVHQVKGRDADEFESAYRDQWMPTLGESDDARLLWFCHHAHGSGPAYHMVTITALRDGAAWERLMRRVHGGDLQDWARGLDELRHGVTGKIMTPVEWSPMQDVDFAAVPTTVTEHELSLFMEDTGWPHVAVEEYTAFWEKEYYGPMRAQAAKLLDIQAVFRTAFGTGLRKEAVLWQKIVDHQGLLRLLTTEVPVKYRSPGTFMYEALAYRDRWESKLLRTSSWSPLY